MKLQFKDMTGATLDWAVARLEFPEHLGYDLEVWVTPLPCDDPEDFKYQPSTDWAQGGPIIEREEIGIQLNRPCSAGREWEARPSPLAKGAGGKWGYGPTPLIAAMRCYVASKLGNEIEIPEELK